MRPPRTDSAICDEAKVRDYLLSREHPIGRAKARFFESLGYTRHEWAVLRAGLIALASTGDAEPGAVSAFGQPYVVRGILHGPAGRAAPVATIWMVRSDEDVPRFVTAYPSEIR